MSERLKINLIRRLWLISEVRRVLDVDRQSLLNGLPALLIGGAAWVFASHVSSVPEAQRLAPYVKGADLGVEPGKHELALLCTERLIQEQRDDPKLRYLYAMICQTDGNFAEAESALSYLAPIDRKGYPPAHLALARLLLTGESVRDARTMRTIERHLEYALTDAEVANESRILLGRIYAATGRGHLAEKCLLPVAKAHPELLLVLARLARERGDDLTARVDLDTAIGAFRDRAEAHVDEIEARLLWADALAARSDFVGMVAILEKGLERSSDPRYHRALARAYGSLANSVTGNDSAAVGKRLEWLDRGFGHAPDDPALLDQLAAIIRIGGADMGRARSILQTQLTDGKATVATHFLLGWDAFSRARGVEARLHWDQAFRLAPNSAVLANNLAWVLAANEPQNLTRALELANEAVKRKPKQPDFHHTRGIVLMKLKRWPEALTDLEAALTGCPDSVETHVALAEVYDQIGSAELASHHRDRAAAQTKQAARQALAPRTGPK